MTRYAKLASFLLPAIAIVAGVGWLRWNRVPPEQRFHNALAALDQGDYERVRDEIEYLQGDPRFAGHAILLNGGLLLKAGRYEEALAEAGNVPLTGELRGPALLISGECLYRLGRLAESEQVMRRLADDQPDHTEARRLLAAIYYDLGAMDQALVELKQVVRLSPNDFRPHRLMGLISKDFERFQEAAAHYRKALSLKPPDAVSRQVVRELAESLVRLREYESALSLLESAGDDAHLLALKSECLWSLGRTRQARRLLDRAVELSPDERSVLLLDGRMRLDAGDAGAAVVSLKRALARDPHDYECRYQLALAYRRSGRTGAYDVEISRMKRSQDLYKRLSELNLQAIRRPRDAEIRDQLADVCQKLGKHKLAKMWSNAADVFRNHRGGRDGQPQIAP